MITFDQLNAIHHRKKLFRFWYCNNSKTLYDVRNAVNDYLIISQRCGFVSMLVFIILYNPCFSWNTTGPFNIINYYNSNKLDCLLLKRHEMNLDSWNGEPGWFYRGFYLIWLNFWEKNTYRPLLFLSAIFYFVGHFEFWLDISLYIGI